MEAPSFWLPGLENLESSMTPLFTSLLSHTISNPSANPVGLHFKISPRSATSHCSHCWKLSPSCQHLSSGWLQKFAAIPSISSEQPRRAIYERSQMTSFFYSKVCSGLLSRWKQEPDFLHLPQRLPRPLSHHPTSFRCSVPSSIAGHLDLYTELPRRPCCFLCQEHTCF